MFFVAAALAVFAIFATVILIAMVAAEKPPHLKYRRWLKCDGPVGFQIEVGLANDHKRVVNAFQRACRWWNNATKFTLFAEPGLPSGSTIIGITSGSAIGKRDPVIETKIYTNLVGDIVNATIFCKTDLMFLVDDDELWKMCAYELGHAIGAFYGNGSLTVQHAGEVRVPDVTTKMIINLRKYFGPR